SYSWHPQSGSSFISTIPDLDIGDTVTAPVPGAEAAATFTMVDGALTALPSHVRLEPAGYPGTLCVQGLTCGTAGAPLDLFLLLGRRYRLSGSNTFDVAFDGACAPSTLPLSGFSVG